MRNLLILLFVTLAGCASTAHDRYAELTEIPADECMRGFANIKWGSVKHIGSNEMTDGELSKNSCVILSDGMRTSYDLFDFVAPAINSPLRLIVYGKSKGIGFGGQISSPYPLITFFSESKGAMVKLLNATWKEGAFTRPHMEYDYSISGLTVGKKYRMLLTSDNSKVGELLQNYSVSTYVPNAGALLVNTNFYYGPFGDISLGLVGPEK